MNYRSGYHHPWYISHRSNIPVFVGLSVTNVFLSLLSWVKNNEASPLLLSITILLVVLWNWALIISSESVAGFHNLYIEEVIKIGFFWFVFTEVIFFASFFWIFFDASLSPSIELGSVWIPSGVSPINPLGVPLLNSVILLSSAVMVTKTHAEVLQSKNATRSLSCTILLGLLFLYLQSIEYKNASFSSSDSIYGSIFYLTTGFHGIHVFLGVIFLSSALYRLNNNFFTSQQHLNLELSIFYWHFVDVVWLFLYIFLYWWSY